MDRNAINNRANQLNPNNEAYWKSRMGNAPKARTKQVAKPVIKKKPKDEPLWKVEYLHWYSPKFQYFTDKMKAIEFVNSLQGFSGYKNVKLCKCYL